jgi:hypothetical protein
MARYELNWAELLDKAKANLILDHAEDDALLEDYLRAALDYAEAYQHRPAEHYRKHPMPPATEQAVLMLAAHFYEARDGSTGGFFADSVQAGAAVWEAVNRLLRLNREKWI